MPCNESAHLLQYNHKDDLPKQVDIMKEDSP